MPKQSAWPSLKAALGTTAAEGEQPLVRLIRDVMARVVNDTEAGGDFLRAALGT